MREKALKDYAANKQIKRVGTGNVSLPQGVANQRGGGNGRALLGAS